MPVLDVTFLKRRISIVPPYVVTIENLAITHLRQPSSTSTPSADVLSLTVGSVVVFRDVVLVYDLCVPQDIVLKFTPSLPRPIELPPAPQGSATRQLVQKWPGTLCLSAAVPPVCYEGATTLVDVGLEGSTLDDQGVRLSIGAVLNLNTTMVCNNIVPFSCIQQDGMPSCIKGAVDANQLRWADQYDLPSKDREAQDSAAAAAAAAEAAAKESNGSGGSDDDVDDAPLEIILPTVLIGSALFAVVAGLLFWRSRRKWAAGLPVDATKPPMVTSPVAAPQPQAPSSPAPGKGPEFRRPTAASFTGTEGSTVKSIGGPVPFTSIVLQPGNGPGGTGTAPNNVPLNLMLDKDVTVDRNSLVGRGTFATVVMGNMVGHQGPVAVKLFHRDVLGGTSADLKTFQQEVGILSRCTHPNVVSLLGSGSSAAGDEVFLVEELMVTNLQREIHQQPNTLPLPRILAIARDVASGLAYLHPTCIHRDLKPANVLLDANGAAKLTDFGLSRLWASTVHTANPAAGTVQYMANECFSNSVEPSLVSGTAPITHQSDIFSFGVLLWEMLSRERPWRGLNAIQVALAVAYGKQRLQMPDEDERFPPKLRKLILQCWDEDPRKRPGAAEIVKRLTLLLNQQASGNLGGMATATASTVSSMCEAA